MTHPSEETLNDYVERELSPAEQVRVATHVEACGECALVVAEIQQVVRDAAALGPITPPPHVWTLIQAQLRSPESESRVAAVQSSPVGPESQSPESVEAGRDLRGPRQRPRSSSWRFSPDGFVNLREATARGGARSRARVRHRSSRTTRSVRERVLLIAVGDHLERSQMVLVELAHAETRDELDISAERQLADDLLASNRLYRQTAQQMGQANVAGILDELERVLVEVARGPSTVSMQQLADIQQRIESQGILFKVKVIGSDIRKQPVS